MEYQGIIIVLDVGKHSAEGYGIVTYRPSDKFGYNTDVRAGELPEGQKVIAHKWLNAPTSKGAVASEFFGEIRLKVLA